MHGGLDQSETLVDFEIQTCSGDLSRSVILEAHTVLRWLRILLASTWGTLTIWCRLMGRCLTTLYFRTFFGVARRAINVRETLW